ncbi:MAG: DUF1156 domain-containing protein [Chloroflexi bacterium]|nr:DUF1156 domain-containing protein [Chloroflexota bacterium]
MLYPVKSPRKLIEVALPLDAINAAASREKSIRHGHPSTLHLWWARRPLAAARAVIFSQLVNDPSWKWEMENPGQVPPGNLKASWAASRKRLFKIIEDLVLWENTTNEEVLERARAEIRRSWREVCELNKDHPDAADLFDPEKLPALHDPFAGGGSIPLEAQRLGLEAYASDLNPVAVLINKAMIEIPPRFAGRTPVCLGLRERAKDGVEQGDFLRDLTASRDSWPGATGLAEDVRYYGAWMREEAQKRIGHLYPRVEVVQESDGSYRHATEEDRRAGRPRSRLTVIAWLWARTVKSPNPAFSHVDVPLAATFILSSKPGKEAYVQPIVNGDRYHFTVKMGTPPPEAEDGTKAKGRGANFRCIISDVPISGDYIKAEGQAGRMGAKLMAVVAEGSRGRIYLAPTADMEAIARKAEPVWKPSGEVPARLTGGTCVPYGLREWGDLFTPRQLVALTTFSDLVTEAREKIREDYLGARASRPQKTRPQETWHSRGYLPHYEAGEVPQHIVFRLHDSLPAALRERWETELAQVPEKERDLQRRKRIEQALDEGRGACWLRNPEIADTVEGALLHFHGERYHLHAWVIMPNHVHALVTPLHGNSLSSILHSWKSYTAKEANRLLQREGVFWQEEYFDRAIRNEDHFNQAVEYIESNPVMVGLVKAPEEWGWGSACWGEEKRAGRPRSRDDVPLDASGTGARAYAEAVSVYLGMALSRLTDICNSLCRWETSKTQVRNLFSRQAIPMLWDFAENNVFAEAAGDYGVSLGNLIKALERVPNKGTGVVVQADAQAQEISSGKFISTDPPYYDNIGYADLSDFFYVWLRRTVRSYLPSVFATMAVPKAEELIANPYRHGSKDRAEEFFLNGMTRALHRLALQGHPSAPITIYYAFKQSETESDLATTSTGWETFLEALNRAGLQLSGTWPMRTELENRPISSGTNALASSIVLVCRKRPDDAPTVSRREFLRELNAVLPEALDEMTRGSGDDRSPVAPVDLSQAIIGPGMAVFSKYAAVLEADGTPMSVRTALQLINRFLAEDDFDADTQFCLHWFEQHGWSGGRYGDADTLSRAKGTSVDGMRDAGVVESGGGVVRLRRWSEYAAGWDPKTDTRNPVWETLHHLVRALKQEGDAGAGRLLASVQAQAEATRQLAYRLYTLCERQGWAEDARGYNELITSWAGIEAAAGSDETSQLHLFEQTGDH